MVTLRDEDGYTSFVFIPTFLTEIVSKKTFDPGHHMIDDGDNIPVYDLGFIHVAKWRKRGIHDRYCSLEHLVVRPPLHP
jgi:hypothetical protein